MCNSFWQQLRLKLKTHSAIMATAITATSIPVPMEENSTQENEVNEIYLLNIRNISSDNICVQFWC